MTARRAESHLCHPVGETATLYLSGSLRPGEHDVLHRVLAGLPSHISVVRVDLGALEDAGPDVVDTVRQVLARCRADRRGTYHLTARRLAAMPETRQPARTDWYPPRSDNALSATYL